MAANGTSTRSWRRSIVRVVPSLDARAANARSSSHAAQAGSRPTATSASSIARGADCAPSTYAIAIAGGITRLDAIETPAVTRAQRGQARHGHAPVHAFAALPGRVIG